MDLTHKVKSTVLVVDDSVENIHILIELLSDKYRVKAANCGKKALDIAFSEDKPDIILLDVVMPEIDGLEVCRRLQSDPNTANIPIIFITAKSSFDDEVQGFALGAVDYISKPFNPPVVLSRINAQLSLYQQSKHLEFLVKERTLEIEKTRLNIIHCLVKAGEYNDSDTGLHVIRMAWYSKFLAQKVSDDKNWIDLVFNAAPMHDVGKIGIPDNILKKPDKLESGEWKVMMTHTTVGEEILGNTNTPLLQMAVEIAVSHHEKWNGEGYPKGLVGEEIPLVARIIAIADVFDALTSERPYKEAWPLEKAINLLKEQAGQHFDPSLVPLFIECMPDILKIKEEHTEGCSN